MPLYSTLGNSYPTGKKKKRGFNVASGIKHGAWTQRCPSITAYWLSPILLHLESLPEEVNIVMHDSLRMLTELNRTVFLSRRRIFSCSIKYQENEHPYSILMENSNRGNFC